MRAGSRSGRALTTAFVVVAGVVLGVVLAVVVSCDAAAPDPDPPAPPPPAAVPGEERDYVFRWSGDEADLPWNRTLYVVMTKHGAPQPPVGVPFFPDEEPGRYTARKGEKWVVQSEQWLTRTIARLLWTVRAEGTFGDERDIVIPLPPRATLKITGDEESDASDDELTVVDESSGARLVAVRARHRGLRFAVWDATKSSDAEDWRAADMTAPPSPWEFRELRPGGEFAVAVRRKGRQWLTQRVKPKAGETVVLDAGAQPAGGGTVRCENPRAELLLGGEFPLPPLRIAQDWYRSVWEGVPPGRHAARYPSGEVVPFEARDGEETNLPREP